MMIIEDKTALNSLANVIIGANKSITDSSATKSGLIEMINNVIPEKSKFSSGIFTPATEITTDNMPEIPFNLGTDDNGDIIVPDMILIYQPQGILENTGNVKAMLNAQIYPFLKRDATTQGIVIHAFKNANVGAGRLNAFIPSTAVFLTETSFFLSARANYPWQAQMPIVWLQIKF